MAKSVTAFGAWLVAQGAEVEEISSNNAYQVNFKIDHTTSAITHETLMNQMILHDMWLCSSMAKNDQLKHYIVTPFRPVMGTDWTGTETNIESEALYRESIAESIAEL